MLRHAHELFERALPLPLNTGHVLLHHILGLSSVARAAGVASPPTEHAGVRLLLWQLVLARSRLVRHIIAWCRWCQWYQRIAKYYQYKRRGIVSEALAA